MRSAIRTVSKTFKWDACHRLINGYSGNCAQTHGHTYSCTVTIKLRKNFDLDQYGFVYDYNEMKRLKKWIDENLDHAVLVSVDDSDFRKFLSTQKGRDKHYVFKDQTSAEVISEHIYKIASNMFDDERVFVSEIHISETCTSEARYIVIENDDKT